MRSLLFLLITIQLLAIAAPSQAGALPQQLSLDEAFKIALRNNPEFQARLALIDVAGGAAISSRSITFPRMRARPSGGIQGPRSEEDARLFGILNADFRLPLFNLAIPPAWEGGDLLVSIATHNYWANVNATLFSIRNLYISTQFIERMQVLLRKNRRIFENVATKLRSETASGVARETEAERASFQAATFSNQLPALEQQRRLNLNRLALLLGVELATNSDWIETVELTSPTLAPPAASLDFPSLLAEARSNRPDLAILYAQANLKQAEAKIAFAAQLPIIDFEVRLQSIPDENSSDTTALELSATGEGGAPTAATLQNNNAVQNEVRFGPTLEWAIFDGFEAYGLYRASKAEQKLALVSAQGLVNEIAIGLKIAQVNLAALNEIIDQLDQALPTANQTSKYARISLLENQLPTSFLEFEYSVDEQQALSLEIKRLEAIHDRALTYSQVDFITGRYLRLNWVEPSIEKRLP